MTACRCSPSSCTRRRSCRPPSRSSDIAGIVKGASEGEGLGNKFLANIREADAICEVVRAFEDDDIVHVNGKVDPSDDIETINTELILADLQTIENALPKLEKDLRGKKIEPAYMEAVKQAKTILEAGETLDKAAREGRFDKDSVYDLHLMTAKPFIYVFNVDDNELANKDICRLSSPHPWLRLRPCSSMLSSRQI